MTLNTRSEIHTNQGKAALLSLTRAAVLHFR
jgi:hypothetical protein